MLKKITLLLIISLFFLGCQSQETVVPSEQEITVQDSPEQSDQVLEDLSQATDGLAASRDIKRKADVHSLANALEIYYATNGYYPNSLDELDTIIPVNPTPGGSDYSYTPIGSVPAQYYDLCYTLEEGGYQCLNP